MCTFQLMHRIDISPSKSEPHMLQRLPKLAERPLEAVYEPSDYLVPKWAACRDR